MQSSIFKFFAGIFHTLALWFHASCTGRFYNKICSFFSIAFKNSVFGRLFSAPKSGALFRESIFGKFLALPLQLARYLAGKLEPFAVKMTENSGIVCFFANWNNISIRIYGLILLSFAIGQIVFRLLFSSLTTMALAAMMILCVIALFCIIVNRTLKSLFKGSWVLTTIGGFFCEIKKDVDSKLFLKDPEFFLSAPTAAILFGFLLGFFASCMPLSVFILIIGALSYVFLTIQHLYFGVFTVILAAPILPTMMLAAACLLCAFSFFLRLLFFKDTPLRPVPLAGYIAFFVLTYVLGTITSFSFIKSAQMLLIYLAFIIFYFVAFQVLDTKKKWKAALIGFVFISGLVALYGIYQNFSGAVSTQSWVDKDMFTNIKVRVYSTFDNPNVLGEYLVLLIPVVIAVLWRSKADDQKLVFGILLLCLAGCMIFTWSRGAWLGMLIACALYLIMMDKRWALLAVVGVLLIPLFLASGSAIAERILSIGNTKDTSTAYRVSIWRGSIHLIQDFWLSGIGPGSDAFSMIYPKYALSGANFALHAHNLFLQLWIEAGISGIISFIALIIGFVRQSFVCTVYQKRNNLTAAVVLAMSAGILGFMFQALTDNVWYNYKMVLTFWIVLAFASSATAPDFNGGDVQ